MQVPGSDNAGPGSDILWPEENKTLLEKKKANGTMLGLNFILSIIFVSECTLSLSPFLTNFKDSDVETQFFSP